MSRYKMMAIGCKHDQSKRIKIGWILLLTAISLRCNNCNDDCPPPLTTYLEVTDSSGKNLYEGTNPALSLDTLKITAIYQEFTPANIPFWIEQQNEKTIIAFYSGNALAYIIRYSSTEADTLALSNYVYNDDKCCEMVDQYDARLNHTSYCTGCHAHEIVSILAEVP